MLNSPNILVGYDGRGCRIQDLFRLGSMAMTSNNEICPNDEFDVPWKDILEAYFPEFLSFFLPEAFASNRLEPRI